MKKMICVAAVLLLGAVLPGCAKDFMASAGKDAANSVNPNDALMYFMRVGFPREDGVDLTIMKWKDPIYLQLVGNPSAEDRDVVVSLIPELAKVPGMPDIHLVEDDGNFVIGFLPRSEYKQVIEQYNAAELSYLIWYFDDSRNLLQSRILIADECTARRERDHYITANMFAGLGLDSDLQCQYPNSIFNYAKMPPKPCALDYKMLELLYDPAMKPGMYMEEAVAAAEAILKQQK